MLDSIRRALQAAALEIAEERRLPNGVGIQLRLANKGIVNVFDNGTVQVQGAHQDVVQQALGTKASRIAESQATYQVKRRVFVVYGHDPTARTQLEAMLRRWDLEPLILDQLPTEGQTVIEKLEAALATCDFGVVLATPDDEGHRRGHPDERQYRARQNVVLEMGMLLAKLGRENVAILLKTQEKTDRPSDIQGLIYIPFADDVAKDAGVTLAKTLVARGYTIDIKRL